mmetsp:Transcript_78003/g.167390  ORF Transcript_78003/g.167390 Transcript_78003/m.167390 type:complete len:295 (-) Transcript_78003:228-1112(-)
MGFQECEDPARVLRDSGLLNEYYVSQGACSLCMAFRLSDWTLVAQGQDSVAEDMASSYFGRRNAQWMRLRHLTTNRIVLFVNHHGPLPVNSGGICGGAATADNLLRLIATAGQPGDAIVLSGDFNANGASETISELRTRLFHVFAGTMDGGIDNIFSNVGAKAVISRANLGNGGSDHDALTSTIEVGLMPSANANASAPHAEAAEASTRKSGTVLAVPPVPATTTNTHTSSGPIATATTTRTSIITTSRPLVTATTTRTLDRYELEALMLEPAPRRDAKGRPVASDDVVVEIVS